MDTHNTARLPQAMSAGLDPSEEMLAEVDEPPDELTSKSFWSTFRPKSFCSKALPQTFDRRESLLTRQLRSETDDTEDEEQQQHRQHKAPSRGLSMTSNWSNTSAASTADLTSDDGKSVFSPAVSPPLPPTRARTELPLGEQPLAQEPKIAAHDDEPKVAGSEKTVEAVLGRRRCITFGCGPKAKPKSPSPPTPAKEPETSTSPPKRRCTLKFVCPSRPQAERKPSEVKRPISPPPPERRPSASIMTKAHRGSDSTVTHASPKSVRKSSSAQLQSAAIQKRRFSVDSDDAGSEATRFHEFATGEEQPEEWTQQSGCHRRRLTVTDTLSKENRIRQLGEEVEEEVRDEDDEAALEDEDNGEIDEDDDLDLDLEDEDGESDEGFRSDDEEGFANSESEGEESDDDWWRPGGYSTAATSAEHLDTMTVRPRIDRRLSEASTASGSSGYLSPRVPAPGLHETLGHKRMRKAVNIHKPDASDLPDSTDFVCGTLDEDRPLEQAFLNSMKAREAMKHKPTPQDIDPSFPTSDPEMEDDDEDDVNAEEVSHPPESEHEPNGMMHGEMDELHGAPSKRRVSPKPQRKSTSHRSPPPPAARHRSPAPPRRSVPQSPPPGARHRSPVPPRRSVPLSPPAGARHRSPLPPPRRPVPESPPPPSSNKLFGHSPRRARSPPPAGRRMPSPANSTASPRSGMDNLALLNHGLGERPALTHTASLPRTGVFQISKMCPFDAEDDDDGSATAGNADAELPKRRAVDIVKGLERKRARRKEKLYQKHCAKAATKGEKVHKVKPGKGAERMREVGLELQKYHGKATHILSL